MEPMQNQILTTTIALAILIHLTSIYPQKQIEFDVM